MTQILESLNTLKLELTTTVSSFNSFYKEMVLNNHPDKGGDPDRFKILQEASGVIKKHIKDQKLKNDDLIYKPKSTQELIKELKEEYRNKRANAVKLTLNAVLNVVEVYNGVKKKFEFLLKNKNHSIIIPFSAGAAHNYYEFEHQLKEIGLNIHLHVKYINYEDVNFRVYMSENNIILEYKGQDFPGDKLQTPLKDIYIYKKALELKQDVVYKKMGIKASTTGDLIIRFPDRSIKDSINTSFKQNSIDVDGLIILAGTLGILTALFSA